MPIKDLGKYKRPGIFIEEIDNSLVELPIQDVLINLVPGFSKKGPVNNPVYIDNTVDFEKIFGTLDKQLENKGSFFHRTSLQMLKSGPIWALNLLKTDPTRDKLNWKSISVSAMYKNGTLKQDAYERFFNRQDFWTRDSESFMDLVNDPTPENDRLLHLTNMGDKTITVFLFKSSITGFDVTAENWYVGSVNVPSYIDPKDYISDYMVDVLILAGDWTDYNTLSVDTTWSRYFTSTGLIKEKVEDFVNEKNVTVVANYDACLIPKFRDKDGRDMYIKNVINNDTDKTGLFCAFNEDVLYAADFQEGKIDLLGNTLVGSEIDEIEFLSYKETLTEAITYTQKYLDSAANVFSFTPDFGSVDQRTGTYTNWITYGLTYTSVSGQTISFSVDSSSSYYVLGGNKITFALTGTSAYNIVLDDITDNTRRVDQLYLTTDNTKIQVLKGYELPTSGVFTLPNYSVNNEDTIHLGYVLVEKNTGVTSLFYTGVTVDDSGYMPLQTGSTGILGMNIVSDLNKITIEFYETYGTKDLTDYKSLRYYKIFDELALNIEGGKAVIINNSTQDKYEIGTNYQISDSTATSNCKISLYVDSAANYDITGLLIYYVDNEFYLTNTTNSMKTQNNVGTTTIGGRIMGTVAKYSTFYQNFYDGVINSLDYFVVDNVDPSASGATRVYVRPFLDANGILTVDFRGSKDQTAGLITTSTWTSGYESKLIIYSERNNWKQTLEIELPLSTTDFTKITQVSVDKNRYPEVSKGSYLEAYVDETDVDVESGEKKPRRMTRIVKTTIDPANSNYKILYTDAPIKVEDNDLSGNTDYITTVYPSIDIYVTDYKGVSLTPFKIHIDSIPNGTETRQADILSVIGVNATSSLAKGLVNKNKISWRYLVDSFGLGLIENSKQEFMSLCGKKLNCLGFLNMPSARMFRKSNNPSFVNDDGSLNLEYVMNGGDENKNPSFLYSFGIGVGETCVGYFFPYVKNNTDGDEKMVPPAAFVATTYMQKHISTVAGIQPWTIAAGLQNGGVSISGTEMDFTNEDLEFLYQMNANPIVRDIRSGYYINSESTAQVNPTTSLSYIHSREVLIELENDLYDMLLRYQWRFNTPSVRAEIKYRADKICKEYMDAGALYDFRNIMDETNNTSEIIDTQKGVLDTYVEIVKGMGMIINNITILGVGKISSSGFAA
jgi:hypothetical protein